MLGLEHEFVRGRSAAQDDGQLPAVDEMEGVMQTLHEGFALQTLFAPREGPVCTTQRQMDAYAVGPPAMPPNGPGGLSIHGA